MCMSVQLYLKLLQLSMTSSTIESRTTIKGIHAARSNEVGRTSRHPNWEGANGSATAPPAPACPVIGGRECRRPRPVTRKVPPSRSRVRRQPSGFGGSCQRWIGPFFLFFSFFQYFFVLKLLSFRSFTVLLFGPFYIQTYTICLVTRTVSSWTTVCIDSI
jgi:hypothetical protein